MEKKYQVFVSSTYTDLVDERKEVTQGILESHCFPLGMELFPASNKSQWEVIKKVIDDCDYYSVIIAGRYGSAGIDDDGKSVGYTEMEFDYACKKGKPIIALIHKNIENIKASNVERSNSQIKKLNAFRAKAKNGRLVAFWDNKDNLKTAIITSLTNVIRESPAVGWIRANNNEVPPNANRSLELFEAQTIKYNKIIDDNKEIIKSKNEEIKDLQKKIFEIREYGKVQKATDNLMLFYIFENLFISLDESHLSIINDFVTGIEVEDKKMLKTINNAKAILFRLSLSTYRETVDLIRQCLFEYASLAIDEREKYISRKIRETSSSDEYNDYRMLCLFCNSALVFENNSKQRVVLSGYQNMLYQKMSALQEEYWDMEQIRQEIDAGD